MHRIQIPQSTIRALSLKHASGIEKQQREQFEKPYRLLPEQGAKQIIAQADGSMICTVPAGRKRKGKRPREWKEVRVVCAQAVGVERAHYAATFESVQQSGFQWGHTAMEAGRGLSSQIHAVGDGALWIQQKSKEVFGANGRFLVDFYHISEYLAAAGKSCRPTNPRQWLKTQQRRLKKGRWAQVITELENNQESKSTPEKEAPVRCALRYLKNRKNHLFYDEAIQSGLPIGSGTVESAHKHVLQNRMKKAGMAWLPTTAESMVQARTCIVNDRWDSYWDSVIEMAA